MEKKSAERGKSIGVPALLRAGVIGTAASFFILLIAALLIWKGAVTESAAGTAVILACLCGGLFAGLGTAGEGGGGLLRALAAGAVTFLLFAAAGSVIGGRLPGAAGAGAPLAACLCGGAAAGLFHVRGRGGRKPNRRHAGKR